MLSMRCTSRQESDEGNAEKGGDVARNAKGKEAEAVVHCMYALCGHVCALSLFGASVVEAPK